MTQVSVLVPHPERAAVMIADGGLPSVSLPAAEPSVSEILASVDALDLDDPVILRTVVTSSTADDLSLLVECDASAALPPSWTWLELDASAIARLEPATSRPAVASWLRERVDGWSPRRPAWSRPGWFTDASSWMVEQMAAAGSPAVGPPRQHHLWGLSVVLRAPSADGDVYLKCPTEIYHHEAAVTRALAGLRPGVMPDVLAVDETRGWLLLRDLGAPELGEQDESLWIHGVVALAGIQRSMLSRTGQLIDLGLPLRSPASLAAYVEELTDDAVLLDRMPADLRHRWLATAPALVESCLRLDALAPGLTLVHGDFHPWNVVRGNDTTRIFDWSDAALSHPFLDLATYVFRTDDPRTRRAIVDAYVASWSDGDSDDCLREAASLALVVGALYQVQTYRTLLPTLMRHGADDDLADGGLNWLTRTLTRYAHGLESPT